MTKLMNIGLIILSAIGFLIALFIIRNILSIFDGGIKNIPFSRYYLGDICDYNLTLGIFAIILYSVFVLMIIAFIIWGTGKINKIKN